MGRFDNVESLPESQSGTLSRISIGMKPIKCDLYFNYQTEMRND